MMCPPGLPRPEVQAALGHGVKLLGMRIGHVLRPAIAVGAVVLIEADDVVFEPAGLFSLPFEASFSDFISCGCIRNASI